MVWQIEAKEKEAVNNLYKAVTQIYGRPMTLVQKLVEALEFYIAENRCRPRAGLLYNELALIYDTDTKADRVQRLVKKLIDIGSSSNQEEEECEDDEDEDEYRYEIGDKVWVRSANWPENSLTSGWVDGDALLPRTDKRKVSKFGTAGIVKERGFTDDGERYLVSKVDDISSRS